MLLYNFIIMLKIAIAIGHNFANGDKGASGNGTNEATVVQKVFGKLITNNSNPNIQFYLVPLRKDINQKVDWIKNNADYIDAYFEFDLDSAKILRVQLFFIQKDMIGQGHRHKILLVHMLVIWD